MNEFFNIGMNNLSDFWELLIRFVFNFIVTFFIARCVYYSRTKRRDFLFTFVLIATLVFLMSFLLENVKLQLGFAMGLFAVFGIIRYRTTPIPIKEMTYLFVVIGISVINALSNEQVSYLELLFANLSVVIISFLVEHVKHVEKELYTTIVYNNADLVTPDKEKELIDDLEAKTGLKISHIEISSVDYVQSTAKIKVFFFKSCQKTLNQSMIDYKENIGTEF